MTTALALYTQFLRRWVSPDRCTANFIALVLTVTTVFHAQADPRTTAQMAEASDAAAIDALNDDLNKALERANPTTPEALRDAGLAWENNNAAGIERLENRFKGRLDASFKASIQRPFIPAAIPKDATPTVRELMQLENALNLEFVALRRTVPSGDPMELRDVLLEWEVQREPEHARQAALAAQARQEQAASEEDIIVEVLVPPNASSEERAYYLEEMDLMRERLTIFNDPSLTPEELRDASLAWELKNAKRLERQAARAEALQNPLHLPSTNTN